MAKYKVLYWYEIPTQVRAEDENGRVNLQLPERFQLAIDELAMAAGLINDDDYANGFKWHAEEEMEGGAQEVAEAVIASLEARFAEIDVHALAASLPRKK